MRDLALSGVIVLLLALAIARPFAGVLAWSWISFMNPHRESWGFVQTMPWAMMTFLATVLGCVIAREPRRFPLNALTVLFVVFAVWITITSLAGIAPPERLWWMWDKVIKVIAGLLLTAAMLTERQRIDAMLWLIAISLGFYGVKGGIFTLLTGGKFIVLGPPESMIGDRNHLAVALLVGLPLMNYLRLQARHRIVRLVLLFAMAITLISAVGSQSRGALVTLAASAFVFWLRSRGKILSGTAIAVAIAAAIAFMPESWVQRMETIRNYQEDGSAMGRITIWMAALSLGLARPLLGTGFMGLHSQQIVDMVAPGVKARAGHSIWFEVIADHGFVGFAIWLGILASGIWYSLRIARYTKDKPDLRWAYDLARMSQVSIVAYMTGGSFLSLSYWDLFWTLLVILGATHALVTAVVREPARAETLPARAWRPQPALRLRPAADRA
jgi:probable O-glycosylation ligase (exosortase A-associated)